MSVLITIAKIFGTLVLTGGVLGGILYIWMGRQQPTHGAVVETIAGIIVLGLSVYGMYFLWS